MKIIFNEDDAEIVAEVLAIERGIIWDSSKPELIPDHSEAWSLAHHKCGTSNLARD